MGDSMVREGRSRTSGVVEPPSWFPLEIYSTELSYAEWAVEIHRRQVLRTAGWEWLKSGEVNFLKALTCTPDDIGMDVSFPHRLTAAIRVYISDDKRILHPSTDFKNELILTIDVSAKDSEIQTAVQELVDKMRLEINENKKTTRPGNIQTRVKRWKKNKMLQVFDLWMWSEINDGLFTWADIEEVVFGTEFDEKARKTAMEEAKGVINFDTVKRL